MLATFRVIKNDGTLARPPTSMNLTEKEAIELQRYLNEKEIRLIGIMRTSVDETLCEHMASIQYDLLDPRYNIAKKEDNESIVLKEGHRCEISVYRYGV